MKTLFIALMLSFSTLSQARDIQLSSVKAHDLKINDSELVVTIAYPGKRLSGVCGVEIRTSHWDITKVMEVLEIGENYGTTPKLKILNSRTVLLDLTADSGMYLTGLSLKSKDGRSLKDNLTEVIGEGVVVLVSSMCR